MGSCAQGGEEEEDDEKVILDMYPSCCTHRLRLVHTGSGPVFCAVLFVLLLPVLVVVGLALIVAV